MSQDPNLPGGITDSMLDEAYEPLRCFCGHEFDDHDGQDGDVSSDGVAYAIGGGECAHPGCSCSKFVSREGEEL